MLEKSLFESGGSARTGKPVTVLVSTILHACAIVTLIVIPILQPQVAPIIAAVGIPLVAVDKPEPKMERVAIAPKTQPQIVPTPGTLTAPITIPRDIALVVDEPSSAIVATAASVPFSNPRLGVIEKMTEVAPPLPPPPPPVIAPPTAGPLRVSNSQLGSLIYQVKPVYPDLAKRARVQGAVVLEATISKDGSIQNLRVVSGHVLLVDAAINAVQQWRYKPTMLNGEPIDVITTITVTFTLQ
jgi:protein TonB